MACISDVVNFLNLIPNPPSITDLAIPTDQSCLDLFSLLQSGTPIFQNSLGNQLQECLDEISTAIGIVDGFTPGATKTSALGVLNDVTSALGTDPSDLGGNIAGGFLGHTNFLNTQLSSPGFLSGTIASLGVKSAAGAIGGSSNNGCLDLDGVLGSLLGSGTELVNNIFSAVQPLLDAVAGGVGAVAGVIAGVVAGVVGPLADIASKILGELNNINSVLSDISQFSFASGLCNLSNDPCAQAIFNAAGTPALLNALPGMPKFP